MSRKSIKNLVKILMVISIAFWINIGWLYYNNYQKESFEKTIDMHQELIYNKNKEINGLQDELRELEETNNKINEELIRLKEEPNRGIKRYKMVTVKTTAYNCNDTYTPSTTMANGQQVFEGAVAYNNAPLGARVEIDGNMYTVCDRVGSDDVIDIYMNSYQDAIQYGVKYKKVKIYI
jgi:3D (Asp-Asp-Asp) domain-containing protein